MKRSFFLPILFVILLMLSSCGKPPTVQNEFSANFSTNFDNIDYTGIVTKDGDVLTVTVSNPYSAQGMVFCWNNDSFYIQYMGHSTEANADYLPADSVPAILHNTLSYLPQAAYIGTENGEDRFTLPSPRGEALLTALDSEPISLTDPQNGMVFRFEK